MLDETVKTYSEPYQTKKIKCFTKIDYFRENLHVNLVFVDISRIAILRSKKIIEKVT